MPCLAATYPIGAGVVAADADQARDRTGEHDRPAVTLLDHRRDRDLDGVVHAGQVDVDDVAPSVRARLHRRDTGVRDHDVQPAEFVEPGLQRVLQRLLIANVGLLRNDSRAGVLDKLDREREIVGRRQGIGHRRDLVADVDRDDVRAVGGQPDRLRAALTPCGAGDESDLAGEGRH